MAFKKGDPGGPGRPKGDRGPYLKPALRKYMLSDVEEEFKPKTRVDELAIALGDLAKQGNQKAIETIRYSLDGAEVHTDSSLTALRPRKSQLDNRCGFPTKSICGAPARNGTGV